MEKQSDPFYHTAAWKAARREALMRDSWLCQECLKRSRIRPATTVHHIIPREDRPDLSLELSNLESVCAVCHNQAHPEKGTARGKAPKAQPAGVRIIRI